jgi:hypothetical protein
MPRDDVKSDILTEYKEPFEMAGAGEVNPTCNGRLARVPADACRTSGGHACSASNPAMVTPRVGGCPPPAGHRARVWVPSGMPCGACWLAGGRAVRPMRLPGHRPLGRGQQIDSDRAAAPRERIRVFVRFGWEWQPSGVKAQTPGCPGSRRPGCGWSRPDPAAPGGRPGS